MIAGTGATTAILGAATRDAAFTVARVHWVVTLTRGGQMLSAEPLHGPPQRGADGRPRRYPPGADLPGVPAVGPRNNGLTPGFLVDSLAWLFGHGDAPSPRSAAALARRYALTRTQLLHLATGCEDPGLQALATYYRLRPQPEPDLFAGFEESWVDPLPAHVACFAYAYPGAAPGRTTLIHRSPAVAALWQRHFRQRHARANDAMT